MGSMVALSVYLTSVSYFGAIDGIEKSEMSKITGVIQTYALNFESLLIDSETDENREYRKIRSRVDQSLYNTNRINNLSSGVSLLLIRKRDGQAEVIGQDGTSLSNSFSPQVNRLLNESPLYPYKLGREESENGMSLFFAYPVSIPSSNSYRGYLFVDEDISNQIMVFKHRFIKQISLTLFVLAVLGFFGHRWLRRILKHETRTKKKLSKYAELAESRNEQLETLSFVLSRSENIILLTDRNGRIEWLNESYQKKNAYTEGELENFVGKELPEVSHYSKISDVLKTVNETKEKFFYETKSFDSDQKEIWTSTTVTPIMDNNGEVDKILFIDADITKLKKAEREIGKLANFAKENKRPLIRIAEDGKVLFANESGQLILRHWNTKVDDYLKKPSILSVLKKSIKQNQEQKINLECENRIYAIRFYSIQGQGYVNLYGEDITEEKTEEKKSKERAFALEQHNLHITDSINYARRIQESILPNEDQIRKFFKNSFVLNKPKDIVSGDFFWIYEVEPEKEYLVALADCTGHGVPGAMMSIVGHSLLNDIMENENPRDPASILRILNRQIIRTLRQKNGGNSSDGMDVSIAHINLEDREVTFAGAYHHAYWMNGKLSVLKGDRHPIGGLQHDNSRDFTNQKIKISEGDAFYLMSDGFVDQFGGPKNKKFLSKRMAELIEKNHKYSMQAQSFIYEKSFAEWKGDNDQVDDVSMLGIKF